MKSGFLRIYTIKSIKLDRRLLVYTAYNKSSKEKMKLYQMYLVCDDWVFVWTRKFVGFGDITNDVKPKTKT